MVDEGFTRTLKISWCKGEWITVENEKKGELINCGDENNNGRKEIVHRFCAKIMNGFDIFSMFFFLCLVIANESFYQSYYTRSWLRKRGTLFSL